MERQDGSAVAEALVEGLVHNSFARHLVLAKVHLEATGLGASVRMDWTAGDAAQAEDTVRRSLCVTEPLAAESRLEEQRLHSGKGVTDDAAVEEHAVQTEAVREYLAIALGKTLDARPWDSPKHQARRSVVVSAAHAEDSPGGQTLEGKSW
jgi:hypothetical protein